jgi:hypothetical protein
MTHRRSLTPETAPSAITGSGRALFSVIHQYCISGPKESIYLTSQEGRVTAITLD